MYPLQGHSNFFLIVILHFDSLEALKAAFATPEGQACDTDRKILAPDKDAVQMYTYASYIDSLQKLKDTSDYNAGINKLKLEGKLGQQRFFAGKNKNEK